MNKIEFSKLSTKEDMILAFNQLKDDYRQLFAINEDLQEENERLKERYENLKKEHIDTITRNEYYRNRKEKAIEYLANCDWNCKDFENLYDILNGGDDNE